VIGAEDMLAERGFGGKHRSVLHLCPGTDHVVIRQCIVGACVGIVRGEVARKSVGSL
jgi:hypothetical protein